MARARWPCGTRHWQARAGSLLARRRQLGFVEVEADDAATRPDARRQLEGDVAAAAAGVDGRETGERLEAVEQRSRRRRQHAGNHGQPRAAFLAALDDVGAQFLGFGHLLLPIASPLVLALHPLHERHGAVRRMHLALGDEVDEHVARLDRRVGRRIGAVEIGRHLAFGPDLGARRPCVQGLRRVAGRRRRPCRSAAARRRNRRSRRQCRDIWRGRHRPPACCACAAARRIPARRRNDCAPRSTWRSFTPSCFSGSSFRKASKSSSSNFLVGANCQRIGPSLSPSSEMPEPRNRITNSPASASTRRLVTKRMPFSEIDETVRRLARPFGEGRRLEGRVVGAVDLDGRHLPAGILQLLGLRQFLRIERACPRARRSSRPCRRGFLRMWSCSPPVAYGMRVRRNHCRAFSRWRSTAKTGLCSTRFRRSRRPRNVAPSNRKSSGIICSSD